MSSKARIIVTGLIAQHPHLGGVTWFYFQYVLGLARLGYEVYYLEDSGEWPYTTDGGLSGHDWIARDCSANVSHLANIMARYGLGDNWAYRFPVKPRWFGMPHNKRREVLATADLLINVSGTLKRPRDYRRVPRLVYIDTDPVFTQVRIKLPRGDMKFQRRVAGHDVFFSYGECLSDPALATEYQWRPTRTPIVLSEWQVSPPRRDVFTTIMNWTSYDTETYGGKTYGQKDVEFRKFLDLPSHVKPALELAIGMGKNDPTPYELLLEKGWRLVDPLQVCPDWDSLRTYTESSKAEWSVAKNGYVVGRSGWFSERSARYLAAGRPVVVQDTGFSAVLPTGAGILPFNTFDEAVSAIEEVEAHYDRHAKAAREIAEEYFDSDKILTRLVYEALNNDRNATVHSPEVL